MDPRHAPHDPAVRRPPRPRRWSLLWRPLGLLAAVAVVRLALSGQAVAGRLDPGEDPAVVRTDDGPVRGLLAGDYRTFEGIPYADYREQIQAEFGEREAARVLAR
jgi:hypothetical protein